MRSRCSLTGLGITALVLTTGCGRSTATVSGEVRFSDRPVTSATVLFHGESGEIWHSLVAANGRYIVRHLPPGKVRIAIIGHAPTLVGWDDAPAGEQGAVEAARVRGSAPDPYALPKRYANPDDSGIVYEVRPGVQTLDLRLTP